MVWHVVALLGAVLVALAGCTRLAEGVTKAQRVVDSAPAPSTSSTSPSAQSPAAAGTTVTRTPPVDTGLAALFVTELPLGFARQPDDVGYTGPLDLAGAVNAQGGPGIEAVLRSSDYVQGHQRRWTDGGFPYQEIMVTLHQHATPAGAQLHFEGFLPFVSMHPSPETPLPVAGLPAASKGLSTGALADFASAMVILRTSSFVVKIDANVGTEAQVRDRAAAVALAQLRRLPA